MKIRYAKTIPEHRKFDAANVRRTRRPYDEVLGEPSTASPRGSTYWKRVIRCPMEHGLWEGGLRKLDPFTDPIVTGLLYHRALEHYYRTLQQGGTGDDAEVAAWASVGNFQSEPGYEDPFRDLERMLSAYFDLYRDHDPVKWKVRHVEQILVAPPGTLEWTGRLDLGIEEDGMYWGVEHKSTRLISEDLLSGYQMDIQIPGYSWLLRKNLAAVTDKPFGGFIVNIATRDKTPKLERVRVAVSQYHLASFEKAMHSRRRFRDAYASEGHPRWYGNCVGAPRYFSRCDYFDVCHGRPEATLHQLLAEDEPLHGFVNVQRLTSKRVSSIDPDEVT